MRTFEKPATRKTTLRAVSRTAVKGPSQVAAARRDLLGVIGHGPQAMMPALQTVAARTSTAPTLPTQLAVQAAERSGTALPEDVRSYFEPRFVRDFSSVRVHTDGEAARAARSIDARAFTVGQDIVFGAGEYAPGTLQGRRLLAHELTHTVQQAAMAGAATVPSLQRAPDEPESQPATPPATSAPQSAPDAKQVEAAKKVADAPPIVDLVKGVKEDLFGAGLTPDQKYSFRLRGTELAAPFALSMAALQGLSGTGGLTFGPDASTSLSTYLKYLDALQPLTPSTSIKTDLPSLMLGMRLDDYLASPQFLRHLNAANVTLLLAAVQGGWSLYKRFSTPTPDVGGFVDEDARAHLGLILPVASAILYDKLKPFSVFDTPGVNTPTHPGYASDSYFGGVPPAGLTVDAAKGAAGLGNHQHFGGGFNLPKWVVPNEENKLSGKDIDDPQKYRGWQLSLWGDYQSLQPTPGLTDAGRLADKRFRGGALFGNDGAFVFGEAGGHYGGSEATKLTSMFLSGGLAYSPPKQEGNFNLKKIGFKATQIDLQPDDYLAPKDATGAGQATSATRFTPFTSFEFKPAPGQTVSLGASAGITTSNQKDVDLSDLRGDISYTYMGTTGTEDLPVFRVSVAASASRVDYFNAASPRLYGLSGRLQTQNFFTGLQVNWGADAIPTERAAQLYDVRTEAPSLIQPGGTTALFVFGVLIDRGVKAKPPTAEK